MKNMKALFLNLFLLILCSLAWQGQDDTESKVDLLNDKAWQISINQPQEAIRLSKEALQLAESAGYLKGISTGCNYLGIFHTDLNQFQEAEKYFLKAVEVRKQMGYEEGVAYVYDNMSRLKKEQGDYQEAIRYGFQAIEILRSLRMEKEEPTLFLNLAIAHHFNRDTADAIRYYQEGLEIARGLKDTVNIASFHYNYGLLRREMDQLDSAQLHLEQALPLFKAIDHKMGEAAVYDALGVIHTKREARDQAEDFFQKSIELNTELRDSLRLFHNYLYLSKLYSGQGDPDQAMRYCDQAGEMLSGMDRMEERELLNREYGNLYAGLGDFEKAFQYLRKAEMIEDSIINDEKNQSILKLQKENAERGKAEAEVETRKQEIKNQRLTGGIGFLTLISLFGLYVLNQRRLANKRALMAYKESQEREIDRKILAATKKIREELSFNMHNHVSTPLTHIKRFLEPVFKQFSFDEKVQTNLKEAMNIVDKTHVVSRDIAYRLKPEKINWVERIKLSLLALEIKDQVTTDFVVNGINDRSFSMEEGEKISSVIGNLLSNVDKHSGATHVKVAIKQVGEMLDILVEDNGKGFDPIRDRGIGLDSIASYVGELNGTMDIASKKNAGTMIGVKIPVSHE